MCKNVLLFSQTEKERDVQLKYLHILMEIQSSTWVSSEWTKVWDKTKLWRFSSHTFIVKKLFFLLTLIQHGQGSIKTFWVDWWQEFLLKETRAESTSTIKTPIRTQNLQCFKILLGFRSCDYQYSLSVTSIVTRSHISQPSVEQPIHYAFNKQQICPPLCWAQH